MKSGKVLTREKSCRLASPLSFTLKCFQKTQREGERLGTTASDQRHFRFRHEQCHITPQEKMKWKRKEAFLPFSWKWKPTNGRLYVRM